MSRGARLPFVLIVVASCSLSACNTQPPALSPEQKQVVGTWSLFKPVEGGSVLREFVIHADGATFTTTCRSIFDNAVADGEGDGKWSVENGIVSLKWVEHAIVGNHSKNIEYDLALGIETVNGETTLIVLSNQDVYKRKQPDRGRMSHREWRRTHLL